jgi:hypothetical protein
MVRNGESWELGDPELNDRGLPVVHNIASKLGCIRPNSDIDLPVHSVFPEDERDLKELVRQLEAQQKERQVQTSATTQTGNITPSSSRTDISSASEHEHSDLEDDHRPTPSTTTTGQVFLSPQSLPPYNDFEPVPEQSAAAGVLFPDAPTMADFAAAWDSQAAMSMMPDFLSHPAAMSNAQMLTQGLLESEFGRLRPHVVSCPNPEVMLGVGDPMMYSGFDEDDGQQMRL